jgi:hypothetical protein
VPGQKLKDQTMLEDDLGFLPGHGWVYLGPPEAGIASPNDILKEVMGTWLGQLAPWDVFATWTFDRVVQLNGAVFWAKKQLRWIEGVAGQPIYAFYTVERGTNGGLLHLHALVGNVGHLKTFCGQRLKPGTWRQSCCLVHGWPCGYARVFSYDPQLGAKHYVAKYVTKRLCEWELIGFPAKPQRSLPLKENRR